MEEIDDFDDFIYICRINTMEMYHRMCWTYSPFFLLLVDPNNIMELNFYTYMYIRVFVCVFLIYRITLKII